MALLQEIWIARILEPYDHEFNFLDGVEDMSEFVENNIINLQEAGVDPEVLYKNSSYPVPVVERPDTPLQLPLAHFDTENTVVRNAEAMQLAYKKMASVVRRHRAALRNKQASRASFDYTPSANSAETPIVEFTGPVVNGVSTPTEDDILTLSNLFDNIGAPEGIRRLVLHTLHFNQLIKNSDIIKKQRENGKPGSIGKDIYNIYGWEIVKFPSSATFDKVAKTKNAWGSTPDANTVPSSFAFVMTEVMKCWGETTMFETLKDPGARGDIIGFQQFFAALPLRNKYIGAMHGV